MPVILSDPPFTFPNFVNGGHTHDFGQVGGGVDCKVFVPEATENGPEGAVIENFCNFSEMLFLITAIKNKNFDTWG